MKSKVKFYRCKHCGNLVLKIEDANVPMICCGEEMEELKPGVTDASLEKHVPKVTILDDKIEVCVGSVLHPMEQAHKIDWVYLETKKGGELRYLEAGMTPTVLFQKPEEEVIAIYAYCNLHGLWMQEVK